MEPNTATETGQIAALAVQAAAAAPHIIANSDGRQFAVVPDGFELRDVTPAGAAVTFKPDHIAQTVCLETAASLSDYLTRFKSPQTTLFANISANSIVGVIDYHAPGSADLAKHIAKLTLPYSTEWALWSGIDGKLNSQLDFARFLEENAQDVRAPDTADLLECVRDMQAVEKADFRARVRPESDNVDFDFSQSTDAGTRNGTLEVPKRLTLSFPVFFGGEPITLEARLRWRKTQDGLQLGVMILRKEQVRQEEFQRVVSQISASADVPAHYGQLA
jgi:uncharacterized protein YfdQ (DUF2303 family)